MIISCAKSFPWTFATFFWEDLGNMIDMLFTMGELTLILLRLERDRSYFYHGKKKE